MKALVLDAPLALRFDTLPDPVVTGGAVLVRVHAAGISERDVNAYKSSGIGGAEFPALGHEIAGVVVGGDLDGKRVVVNPLLTCGECSACLSGRTNLCPDRQLVSTPEHAGGLAEFVTVPRGNVVQVPDGLPFTVACLVEPLARGWHVARMSRRAFPRGRQALVIGEGALGLGAKLALSAQGIDNTVITNDQCGAGVEYDIIIDVTGTPASHAIASRCVAAGGVIGLVRAGASPEGLDLARLSKQEVTLMCTCAYTEMDFRDTAAAAFEGRLGPLDWAVIRPMADGPQMFEDIAAGRITAPRIILAPMVAEG